MIDQEEIIFILIKLIDTNEEIWVSKIDYETNPILNSYIIKDHRKIRK